MGKDVVGCERLRNAAWNATREGGGGGMMFVYRRLIGGSWAADGSLGVLGFQVPSRKAPLGDDSGLLIAGRNRWNVLSNDHGIWSIRWAKISCVMKY